MKVRYFADFRYYVPVNISIKTPLVKSRRRLIINQTFLDKTVQTDFVWIVFASNNSKLSLMMIDENLDPGYATPSTGVPSFLLAFFSGFQELLNFVTLALWKPLLSYIITEAFTWHRELSILNRFLVTFWHTFFKEEIWERALVCAMFEVLA